MYRPACSSGIVSHEIVRPIPGTVPDWPVYMYLDILPNLLNMLDIFIIFSVPAMFLYANTTVRESMASSIVLKFLYIRKC